MRIIVGVIWHSMKSKCMILIFDLLQLPQIAIDPSPFLISAADIFKFKQNKMNEKD